MRGLNDLWLIVMLCLSTAPWSGNEKLTRHRLASAGWTSPYTKGKKNRTVPVAGWLLALPQAHRPPVPVVLRRVPRRRFAPRRITLPAGQRTH